ncbi:mercury resistance system transport protein MerF [Jannaschia seohaensis]|uniref:Mercuric ion transport protein n=1 Tax=Jannaschia seohaensis TaxID=475081 RepID=A0A2Y9A1L9_9RHOB|nr:mercury resistance system transport protein MerF [Jannaschia seohaensis]PWJ22163.1 mercuric ion transport protein [Jannaschia seohaensis]SSA38441.1 mercuric ion transport protein [Jannaschia seohaensis]
MLKTGLLGLAVTAICCFTPILPFALGAIGFGAAIAWLDWVLLPALAGFAGLTAWALIRRRTHR